MGMSATDELRRLLDERGVEWYQGPQAGRYETEWVNAYDTHSSSMEWSPTLTVMLSGLTPEQAIAATLGNDGVGRTNDGVAKRERDQLKAENAKLRELAKHLFECTHHNTCAVCPYAEDACDFDYDMRELEVVE